MKKILFVNLSLYNGGAEKSLVNLLNELPTDKYEIDLLLFKKEGLFLNQIPSTVNIIEQPRALKLLYGPLKKGGIYGIIKLVGTVVARFFEKSPAARAGFRWKNFYSKVIASLEKEYDVALSYVSGEVAYFVEDKVKAKKKIVWVHNDYRASGFSEKYDRPNFKVMDRIVTISDDCLRILNEVFPEYRNKEVCIANITSSSVIRNRAELFYPTEFVLDCPAILSIGRLNKQKGFDWAIDAAKIIKEKNIKFKWFVIGDGDLEQDLKKQIYANNVEDCFILLGTRENPYPYIKNCTIFAQTSRFEGKSVVLDEAKILKKPIVVTNYTTVVDQIQDEIEGIIVEQSPEAIAEGIERLLSDVEKQKMLTANLENNEYGNSDEVKKYIKLLDS